MEESSITMEAPQVSSKPQADLSNGSNSESSISINSNKTLDTFTLFPLLPEELRRKIWRHALPPARQVFINNNSLMGPDYTAPIAYKCVSITSENTIPKTSRINQESRGETLGFYNIVFGPDEQDGPKSRSNCPLIIDTDNDIICISPLSLHKLESESYFDYLDSESPGLLASIKVLHVLYWNSAWPHRVSTDSQLPHCDVFGRGTLQPHTAYNDLSKYDSQLLRFPGLKQIKFFYIIGNAGNTEARRLEVQMIEKFNQRMSKLLEGNKATFGGIPPKFTAERLNERWWTHGEGLWL